MCLNEIAGSGRRFFDARLDCLNEVDAGLAARELRFYELPERLFVWIKRRNGAVGWLGGGLLARGFWPEVLLFKLLFHKKNVLLWPAGNVFSARPVNKSNVKILFVFPCPLQNRGHEGRYSLPNPGCFLSNFSSPSGGLQIAVFPVSGNKKPDSWHIRPKTNQ